MLLALWSVWFSLAITAFVGLISPLLLGLEYLWYGELYQAKAFATLAFVGIGILFVILSKRTFINFKNLTKRFWAWHARTVRGEQQSE